MINERTTLAWDGFSVTRKFRATQQAVFAGWAVAEVKRRWFAEAEGFMDVTHELDFRVGGIETCVGRQAGGRKFSNRAIYHEIVPDWRLTFSYSLAYAGTPVSASVAIVELEPHSGGTDLVFTEHGVYLRGKDESSRRVAGWRWLLDRLADEIHGTARV